MFQPILEARFTDGAHARALIGNLCLVIWRSEITDHALDGLAQDLALVSTRFPRGIAYLSIVEERMGMPTPERSKRLGEIAAKNSGTCRIAVLAIEAPGIRGKLARIAFNTVNMISPGEFPRKACASIEEAMSLLAPHVEISPGQPASREELLAQVRAFRAGLEGQLHVS